MVFSSVIFIFLFLPIVILAYRFIPKKNTIWQNIFLLLVSSIFYYYGEQEKILLMYFVVLINYLTALYISKNKDFYYYKYFTRKAALFFCLFICIGLLYYYKYFNFSIEIFNALVGGSLQLNKIEDIVLPLGISFYTFHVLSYTLDVYYGNMVVEKNLLNFATYVLMFPQLVAGPIVRYKDIQQQFYNRIITGVGFFNGVRRFCFGLSKKVLLANTLAVYVDQIFATEVVQLSFFDCWVAAIAYTLQIYFDFSGYSDMAIGIALMFGFHYKENFNYPYIAKTAGEFWRRWHISLSSWLRDYVYIHLGGNRCSTIKSYRNVILVFLVSGLWHGANMTFVCWGLIYGIFIVFENMGLKKFLANRKILSHCYLLTLVTSAWVIFRADTLEYAKSFIMKMYLVSGDYILSFHNVPENNVIFALVIGSILAYDWRVIYKNVVYRLAKINSRSSVFLTTKILNFILAILLLALSISSIISSSHNPFIYFRF